VRAIELLHQDREVERGWSASDDGDFH
jgi:hypothetical protein